MEWSRDSAAPEGRNESEGNLVMAIIVKRVAPGFFKSSRAGARASQAIWAGWIEGRGKSVKSNEHEGTSCPSCGLALLRSCAIEVAGKGRVRSLKRHSISSRSRDDDGDGDDDDDDDASDANVDCANVDCRSRLNRPSTISFGGRPGINRLR